jgi:hypothetical protein
MLDAKYYKEKAIADYRGCSVYTLRNERFLGKGIPFVKDGRSVRYWGPDVINYMKMRRVRVEEK